jgi:tetratricopeptide (TPR) repeat protein
MKFHHCHALRVRGAVLAAALACCAGIPVLRAQSPRFLFMGAGATLQGEVRAYDSTPALDEYSIQSAQAERPAAAVVSLKTLGHKVPNKAMREFEKAETAAEKKRPQEAIARLKRALEIDPAFMEAYNNLGNGYLQAGDFENARLEFQKALALDETAGAVASNLGLALYMLKRYPEAEKYARQAVKLDSTSNKPRYILALTLYAQQRNDADVIENLKAAAREYPKARLLMADVLARHGNRNEAADELKKYLSSPAVDNRATVEGWLAQLETTQTASAPPAGDRN